MDKESSRVPAEGRGVYTSPHIGTYTKSNQVRWNQFSQETVSMLAQKLKKPQRPKAKDLMLFLGGRRGEIAKELNHGESKEGFGILRSTDEYKNIILHEKIASHSGFRKYYQPALDLITPYFTDENDEDYDDNKQKSFAIDQCIRTYPHSRPAHRYRFVPCQELRISYDNQAQEIFVIYPKITHELEDKFFNKLDEYIDQLMAWKPEDGIEAFLKIAAYIAYESYRFLPFRYGTSAITNWLVRGIAEAKGIYLGSEKKEVDLPLDFRSFFTLEKEKYAEWYCKNAYEDVRILSKKELCLNELKIFLGFTVTPNNKNNYKIEAVKKHTGLRELKNNENLDLDAFFEKCSAKKWSNNFFDYLGRDSEIEKLYGIGRKCQSNPSDENFQKLLDYLQELNAKKGNRNEMLGYYYSLK